MRDGQQTIELDEKTAGGLEQLRKQERVWFNWVCRLHDVHAGTQTPQSAAILSIARRRWAEARRALERAETRMARPPDVPASRQSRAQPD
jgi:hypothetical protein